MRNLPEFTASDFDAHLVAKAMERPPSEPWIDSLAHAAGPDVGLVYDGEGLREVVVLSKGRVVS